MLKNYMMKISEMPRISRHEVGENLDHYLERIDKEGIGFVITDEGKPDLVLCPAWWFSYCFDKTFSTMIQSAVKGAIYEDGLTPGEVGDFIRKHLNVIDIETLDSLIAFLTEKLENAKDIPNPKAWEVLVTDLQDQKDDFIRRIELIENARKASEEDKETVTLSIDTELLLKTNATLVKLGLDLEEVISNFLEEVVIRQAIPYEPWNRGKQTE